MVQFFRLTVYNQSYRRWKLYVVGIGICDLFCTCECDLYLDPVTFIYELDPHSLELYLFLQCFDTVGWVI